MFCFFRLRNRGQGYVNCLTAASEGWSELSASLQGSASARSLRLPWLSMSLGSSGKSRSLEKRLDFRHKTPALRKLTEIAETKLQQIHSDFGRTVFGCYAPISVVSSQSRAVRFLQRRLQPSLGLLRRHEDEVLASASTSAGTAALSSRSPLFKPSPSISAFDPFPDSSLSVKLSKLDELLRQIRKLGERVLVFCQMPEMLDCLRRYLNSRHFSFTFLEPEASLRKRTTQLHWFDERENILVLLVSTSTPVAGFSMPSIDNVIFFDANWNSNSEVSYENGNRASLNVSPCLQWCRRLRSRKQQLKVFRLVCGGTVEDTISAKSIQERILCDIKIKEGPTNGSSVPVFTINRQTLEALLTPKFGDNGIIAKVNENHDSNWTDHKKVRKIISSNSSLWYLVHYHAPASSCRNMKEPTYIFDFFDSKIEEVSNFEGPPPSPVRS